MSDLVFSVSISGVVSSSSEYYKFVEYVKDYKDVVSDGSFVINEFGGYIVY